MMWSLRFRKDKNICERGSRSAPSRIQKRREAGPASWHHNDLTALAGAPNAASGSALDGYQTSFNNQQHVNYIGTDNHVHELYFGDAWHHNDLTALAGAPNAASGSALDGYQTSFNNQQHVNYIGTDNHVHELYCDNAWHHNDLSTQQSQSGLTPSLARTRSA